MNIRRKMLIALASTVVIGLVAALTWWSQRSEAPVVANEVIADGMTMTRVRPSATVDARVLLLTPANQQLDNKRLEALSTEYRAEIALVQFDATSCPDQQNGLRRGLKALGGAPTLVAAVGPFAPLAWQWLAGQDSEQAQALSVGLDLEHSTCSALSPRAKGHWLVAWNENPDTASANFVRSQANAQISISDYAVPLPEVLDRQLHRLLAGNGEEVPALELPAPGGRDTVTLFLSGDGGWRDLDRDIGRDMASRGYPVVGIDTLRYYWQHKSPERSAADLTRLMAHYREAWGAKHFVLAGYSFGADVLPAIYNRLDADLRQQVDAVILLAFARNGSFEIQVQGWLGASGAEMATGPEIAQLPAAKLFCVYGSEESQDSGCTDPSMAGETLMIEGGHHFDGNYTALAHRLTDAIDKRQQARD